MRHIRLIVSLLALVPAILEAVDETSDGGRQVTPGEAEDIVDGPLHRAAVAVYEALRADGMTHDQASDVIALARQRIGRILLYGGRLVLPES